MTRIEKWAPKRQQMNKSAEQFIAYVNELEQTKEYYRKQMNELLVENTRLEIDKGISEIKLRMYETAGN